MCTIMRPEFQGQPNNLTLFISWDPETVKRFGNFIFSNRAMPSDALKWGNGLVIAPSHWILPTSPRTIFRDRHAVTPWSERWCGRVIPWWLHTTSHTGFLCSHRYSTQIWLLQKWGLVVSKPLFYIYIIIIFWKIHSHTETNTLYT